MEYIHTADNQRLPVKYICNDSDKIVILSHGIATNKDEDGIYEHFVEKILSPVFDSIRFDFRGHGDSTFPTEQITIAGEILDFMAVVRWARQRQYNKIFHIGTSFGASITLLSLAKFSFNDFKKVVFWNPVVNYKNTFIESKVDWGKEFFNQKSNEELAYRNGILIPDTNFTIGPEMAMELLYFSPQETVWDANVPLLIIHGDKDSAVPYEDAVEYSNNNPSTKFRIIHGVDHGFDDKIEDVYQMTYRWLTDNG